MVLRFIHRLAVTAACAILIPAAGGNAEDKPMPVSRTILAELTAPPSDTLEALLEKSSPLEQLEGYASYYAKRFNGRKTASGHRYHPEKMTAAHIDLPMGTVVRVVNPATKQEVQVTVNDRCAPKPFHFIDLSRAAARKIGLLGKGRIKVIIIPIIEEKLEEPA